MSVGTRVVKKTAKTALKENWCNAIIVCTAMILSCLLCSLSAECIGVAFGELAANIAFFVMIFFLFAPLFLGVIRYFWRMLFGVKDHPALIFRYFSERRLYGRALRVAFAVGIRAAIFSLFIFIPAMAAKLLSGTAFYDFFHLAIPIWASNLVYLSTFFTTVGKVLLFFFLLRFYALPFLAAADEEMEVGEAIHRSAELSRFASWEPFSLIVSFLGWLFLCLLAVPAIFILPYFLTAACVQFRFMIAAYNKEADRRNASSFPVFDAT